MARTRPLSGKTLAISFLAFLATFLVTHVVKFPGSLSFYKEVSHGIPILDFLPSFSVDETYARLDRMGQSGRDAYFRLMITIDLVFPLAMAQFLAIWGMSVCQHISLLRPLQRTLCFVPWLYLGADFVENAIVLFLLCTYPEQQPLPAAVIGYFTVTKRAALYAALFGPLVALLGGWTLGKKTTGSSM